MTMKHIRLSEEAKTALASLIVSLNLRSVMPVSETAAINLAIIEQDKAEKLKRPAQPIRGIKP